MEQLRIGVIGYGLRGPLELAPEPATQFTRETGTDGMSTS